jgi:hypothetical protein
VRTGWQNSSPIGFRVLASSVLGRRNVLTSHPPGGRRVRKSRAARICAGGAQQWVPLSRTFHGGRNKICRCEIRRITRAIRLCGSRRRPAFTTNLIYFTAHHILDYFVTSLPSMNVVVCSAVLQL